MLLLGEVKKRQQNIQGHYVLAPFLSFALNQVHLYLVPFIKLILNGFCDLLFNTVNACLVHALRVQDDARLLVTLADGAQRILICYQFLLLLGHALVKLRVNGIYIISIITD